MVLALASDHGGYELKLKVREYLDSKKIKYVDIGTDSTESVDYPVYGKACAKAVAEGGADRGIVFCGTGIGISIAANKVKGIRCALCTSVEMAELCRQHNNANVLALGGRTTDPELAIKMVDAFLNTEFEGGRHQRRIDMIED